MGKLLIFRMPFFIRCSYNSSRDKEDFPKRFLKIAKNSQFWTFLAPAGHNFDLSENLTKIVSLSFLTSFRTFFRFSLRTVGAEIDGGCSTPPPPSRWWKIWSASGARVKFRRICPRSRPASEYSGGRRTSGVNSFHATPIGVVLKSKNIVWDVSHPSHPVAEPVPRRLVESSTSLSQAPCSADSWSNKPLLKRAPLAWRRWQHITAQWPREPSRSMDYAGGRSRDRDTGGGTAPTKGRGDHRPLTSFFPCNAHRLNVKISHSRGHGAPVSPAFRRLWPGILDCVELRS